jgi:hypothetical protein
MSIRNLPWLIMCLICVFLFGGCDQNPIVSQIRLKINPLNDSQSSSSPLLRQDGNMKVYAYDVTAQRLYTPVEFTLNPQGGVGEIPSLPLGTWKFYLHGQSGNQFLYGSSSAFEIAEEKAFEIQAITGRSECVGQLPPQSSQYGSVDLPLKLVGQSSVALDNGQILITGGATLDENTGSLIAVSNQIMLFDPLYGTTQILGDSLNVGRAYHQATLLRDGRIVITGGISDGLTYTNSLEILTINPDQSLSVESSSALSIGLARAYHQAIFIPDSTNNPNQEYDSILIVGGMTSDANVTPSTVRYFPKKNIVVPQGNLSEAKAYFTLNPLPRVSEPVVAIGGLSTDKISDTVEYFSLNNNASCSSRMENSDPNLVGCWIASTRLQTPRWGHQSQTIDGAGLSVLIMGGFSGGTLTSPSSPIAELEMFDTVIENNQARPQTRQDIGTLSVPTGFGSSATFFDGSVIYAGGQDSNGNSRKEVFKISTTIDTSSTLPQVSSVSIESSCPLSEDRMGMNGVKSKDGMFFLIGGKRQGRLNNNPYYPTSKRIEMYVPTIRDYSDLSKQISQ